MCTYTRMQQAHRIDQSPHLTFAHSRSVSVYPAEALLYIPCICNCLAGAIIGFSDSLLVRTTQQQSAGDVLCYGYEMRATTHCKVCAERDAKPNSPKDDGDDDDDHDNGEWKLCR